MHFRRILSLVLIFLLLPLQSVLAEHTSSSKGKLVNGKVTELRKNTFKLKTDRAILSIVLVAQTAFECGDRLLSRKDLREGQEVSVFGTKQSSGQFIAKEVHIDSYSKKLGRKIN